MSEPTLDPVSPETKHRAEGVPESTQVPSKGSERPAETVNLLLSRPSPSAPTSADVDAALDTAVRPETKSVITGHNGADVDAETVREGLAILRSWNEDGGPSGVQFDAWEATIPPALDRLLARLRTAEAEGKKDYEGMREFQAKYIRSDHEVIALRAERDRYKAALENGRCQQCGSWFRDMPDARTALANPKTCPTCGATEPNDWTAGLHAEGFCPDPFHANPKTEEATEFPVGTMGRTDGLTDDMGG